MLCDLNVRILHRALKFFANLKLQVYFSIFVRAQRAINESLYKMIRMTESSIINVA